MANHRIEPKGDTRKPRLSALIITRSPSSRGEIPAENIGQRAVDDRKRGEIRVERGDTSEVDQEG
jgi:hypothetical protein